MMDSMYLNGKDYFGGISAFSSANRKDAGDKKSASQTSINVSGQLDSKKHKKVVNGLLLASALSAAVFGGVAIAKTHKLKTLKASIGDLTARNERLSEANEALQKEMAEVKGKLNELVNSIGEKNYTEEDVAVVNKEVLNTGFGYKSTEPPTSGGKPYERVAGAPDWESYAAGTEKRAEQIKLEIPEISSDGAFDFKLPHTDEENIVKCETKEFTSKRSISTSISESYADAVQWDNAKILRDIVQNHFDGHGQTLDGVHFKAIPLGDGRYRIRIEGDSTYGVDKAIFIGESTKRGNANAAGNYGEGLKMAALKLLRDKGADSVRVASDNWKLTYSLEKTDLSDKRVLQYSLDNVAEKLDGNYIEFETTDADLITEMRKTIDRFYHSGNEHFIRPDFENEYFGIKVLENKNDKGAIYIAGQRFEYQGSYEGLPGMVLFLKRKPPIHVLDPSRDRTSLNLSQLNKIAEWLSQECTTYSEKIKVMKALEKYIKEVNYQNSKAPDDFLETFIRYAKYAYGDKLLSHVNFPENYVAYSQCSEALQRDLVQHGYVICKSTFSDIGMRTIHDLMGEARKHNPLEPNSVEHKKILILRKALKELSCLEDKHFTPEELDAKIFLFEAEGAGEKKLYSGTLAEAIIDGDKSQGFWIDREYLNNGSFSDILETALHELSHKAGGDGSADFSYKLTDVNRVVIKEMIENPALRKKFNILNEIWNKTNDPNITKRELQEYLIESWNNLVKSLNDIAEEGVPTISID